MWLGSDRRSVVHHPLSLPVSEPQISNRCILMLTGHLKQLETLDVSGVSTLTEPGFMALMNLPKLTILRARATQITDLAVANLLVVLEVCQ